MFLLGLITGLIRRLKPIDTINGYDCLINLVEYQTKKDLPKSVGLKVSLVLAYTSQQRKAPKQAL